jgi:hypothetical protein
MPSSAVLTPSGDISGVTDTTAINTALSGVGAGGNVLLGPGDWYIDAPLNVPSGAELAGIKGGINGATSKAPAGSVIHPVEAFASTLPASAAIFMQGGAGRRIRDLAILNDLVTGPGVDGVAGYGAVVGTEIEHLSVALVTGNGVAFYADSGGNNGDGLWMDRCIIQQCTGTGIYRPVNDANLHAVHVQGCTGEGFFTDPDSGGNITFVGCRSDENLRGWHIDHQGTFGDATKLTGCSTELNGEDGVLVTNSSADGRGWRSPVVISGCCFEGDGSNGGPFAGIRVQGRNRVFIGGGTVVMVNTKRLSTGAPFYSLAVEPIGTGGGVPDTVAWSSGRMNYAAGGAAVDNPAAPHNLLIGPTVTQAAGYESIAPVPRAGKVTLADGTATVTSPWAFPESLIHLTNVGPSGTVGTPCVSTLSAGSFTIQSTSDADASTVAWMIM